MHATRLHLGLERKFRWGSHRWVLSQVLSTGSSKLLILKVKWTYRECLPVLLQRWWQMTRKMCLHSSIHPGCKLVQKSYLPNWQVNIIFYLPNEKFTSQNSFSQKAMYFYLKNKNINICARKIHTNKMLVLLWFRRLFVIIIKLSRTVYFASIFLPVKVTGRLFFLPVRFEIYPWFVG